MIEQNVERVHTEHAVLDIGQDIGALVHLYWQGTPRRGNRSQHQRERREEDTHGYPRAHGQRTINLCRSLSRAPGRRIYHLGASFLWKPRQDLLDAYLLYPLD
jgi:hypothetical protein